MDWVQLKRTMQYDLSVVYLSTLMSSGLVRHCSLNDIFEILRQIWPLNVLILYHELKVDIQCNKFIS